MHQRTAGGVVSGAAREGRGAVWLVQLDYHYEDGYVFAVCATKDRALTESRKCMAKHSATEKEWSRDDLPKVLSWTHGTATISVWKAKVLP
jgi:hypothetical protein